MVYENDSNISNEIEKSTVAPWIQKLMRTLAVASFGARVETNPVCDPAVAESIQQALNQTAILAVAPHDSHFNTPVIQTALWRYVSRMVTVAKSSYFSVGSPKLALHMFNPRWYLMDENGAGLKTLAGAIEKTKAEGKNDLFLVYPQGSRSNPLSKKMNEGVAFMARKAEVPIIPILLSHNGETIMPKGTSVWHNLKSGMQRALVGKPEIQTISLGKPVDPVQLRDENPTHKGRSLDPIIMDALRQNLQLLISQLDQEVPPFLQES